MSIYPLSWQILNDIDHQSEMMDSEIDARGEAEGCPNLSNVIGANPKIHERRTLPYKLVPPGISWSFKPCNPVAPKL